MSKSPVLFGRAGKLGRLAYRFLSLFGVPGDAMTAKEAANAAWQYAKSKWGWVAGGAAATAATFRAQVRIVLDWMANTDPHMVAKIILIWFFPAAVVSVFLYFMVKDLRRYVAARKAEDTARIAREEEKAKALAAKEAAAADRLRELVPDIRAIRTMLAQNKIFIQLAELAALHRVTNHLDALGISVPKPASGTWEKLDVFRIRSPDAVLCGPRTTGRKERDRSRPTAWQGHRPGRRGRPKPALLPCTKCIITCSLDLWCIGWVTALRLSPPPPPPPGAAPRPRSPHPGPRCPPT